jgi:FIMAH domain-containing protein
MRRILLLCTRAVTLFGLLLLCAGVESASAGTFTVTNVNDSGPGSLRQAILDSNADNVPPRQINFAIGSGVQTISPMSQLPRISAPVTVDGTTQPGFAGTPIIEINGTNAGTGVAGLIISAGFSTIRGLVINRFNGDGIFMFDTNGNVIEGNFIGTDVTGSLDLGNSGHGVFGSLGIGFHVIRENVISGNGRHGVSLSIGLANSVLDNFIGTDASGTFALGNDQNGIQGSLDTLIVKRNVISANGQNGIVSFGSNLFQGNLIGTDVTGTLPLGNSGAGIRADIDEIGGPNPEDGNTIAFNGGDGVVVSRPFPVAIPILSNSLFSNGGLGIDIDDDGVTSNDSCDADSTPIALQNFPVLTSAVTTNGSTVIQGTLDSKPNSSFLIQFFSNAACDPSGFGEGQNLIGSITVTSGASCVASFLATFPSSSVVGGFITATATEQGSSTSEFSQCVGVVNQGAAQAIQSLLSQVAALVGQGVLSDGAGNRLSNKLQAALQQLERGNTHAAANQINAFINQVETLVRTGKLSPQHGQPLIDAARAVF